MVGKLTTLVSHPKFGSLHKDNKGFWVSVWVNDPMDSDLPLKSKVFSGKDLNAVVSDAWDFIGSLETWLIEPEKDMDGGFFHFPDKEDL